MKIVSVIRNNTTDELKVLHEIDSGGRIYSYYPPNALNIYPDDNVLKLAFEFMKDKSTIATTYTDYNIYTYSCELLTTYITTIRDNAWLLGI